MKTATALTLISLAIAGLFSYLATHDTIADPGDPE